MQTSAVSPVVLFGRIISPPKLEPCENGDGLKRKFSIDEKPSLASPESATAAENGSLSSQESVVTADNGSFPLLETANTENTSSKRLQTQGSLENPSVSAPSVSNEASKRKDGEFSMVNSQANDEVASFQSDKRMRCPRCDSYDTKFCYFNNYNVKQPRHFCRNCQRYWTAGGSLRNVPVGAGRRRNKTGNSIKQSSSDEIQVSDHSNSGLCNATSKNMYMASSSSSSPSTSGYNSSSLPSSTTVTSGSRYIMTPLPSSSTSPSLTLHCSQSVPCTSKPTSSSALSSSPTASTVPNHISPGVLLQPKLEETSPSTSCSTMASVSQSYMGISAQSMANVAVQSGVGLPMMWPLPWPCQVSAPSQPGGVLVWPYQAWPQNPNSGQLSSASNIPQTTTTANQRFPLPSHPQQQQLNPFQSPPHQQHQQNHKNHNLQIHHSQPPNSPSSVSAFQPFNSNSTLYQSKQQHQPHLQMHHKQQLQNI